MEFWGEIVLDSTNANKLEETRNLVMSTLCSEGDSGLEAPMSIVKTCQALAGDLSFDQLVVHALDAMVKFAGAKTACLVFPMQDQWIVQAHHTGSGPATMVAPESIVRCGSLPSAIVLDVARSGNTIALQGGALQERLGQDGTALTAEGRWVLCVPMGQRGSLIAIAYLEGEADEGEISAADVAAVEVVSVVVAASLEKLELRREVERSRDRVKKMRAQVLAQEKMATLGAITSGIAHEIKNPLNFVVNFASLSVDLVREIREEMAHDDGNMSPAVRENVNELLHTLADNCDKVNQHGLRADSIVRSMQMHARGQAGQPEATDINRLLEENLSLAFHGARALDREFNAMIEKNLAPDLPRIQVVPQEMGRVFLNLFTNGLYAARAAASAGRLPTLRVTTHDHGDSIQIRIADNGMGIPEDVRPHIFEAFFTTKPIGVGTGLGLSISHEIVVQAHKGALRFESVVGEGTEFIIELPKTRVTG